MELWIVGGILVLEFRPAFGRFRTFLWFVLVLSAMCIRQDHRFVTCLPRALGLPRRFYERFLGFFHSRAVNLDGLTRLWVALALRILKGSLLTVNGRIVPLADGIKVAKSGRKMPAVKKLHQESQNNSKPEYIFGHSCQAIALVVAAASSFFALPLCCRIHEGVVFSNRNRRTLLDKLVALLFALCIDCPCYLEPVPKGSFFHERKAVGGGKTVAGCAEGAGRALFAGLGRKMGRFWAESGQGGIEKRAALGGCGVLRRFAFGLGGRQARQHPQIVR